MGGLGFKTPRQVSAISTEAFIFAYPLVLMELTRQQFTATSVAGELLAPMNQFAHMREPPSAPVTPVVNPNRDALYSSAWVDLSAGPVVLSMPEVVRRYFTMPMYDAWTRVFVSPGTRTTGTGARSFIILGPSLGAKVPSDPTLIRAPTNTIWIIGRIEVAGPEDYPTVHRLQQKFSLTLVGDPQHLSAASPAGPDPGAGFVSPPTTRLERMGAHAYFSTAVRLLAANPPRPEDAGAVRRVRQIRMLTEPSSSGTPKDERVARDIARGMAEGLAQIEAAGHTPQGVVRNRWVFPRDPTQEPRDYLQRAAAAWTGLGAMPLNDCLTSTNQLDAEGQLFSGEHRYRLRFAPGATPPVRASWSLAVQEIQPFFGDTSGPDVIGSRSVLRCNDDGSLDVYLQRQYPCGGRSRNWLRAPTGAFSLVLRLYWPLPEAIDGRWLPPPVERLD